MLLSVCLQEYLKEAITTAATMPDSESTRRKVMDRSFKVIPTLLGLCSGITSSDFAVSSSALTVLWR